LAALALVGACLVGRVNAAFAADEVGRLVETLHSADSFKVRLQAAAVLARFKDPRVVGALGRAAMFDQNRSVRMLALRLLARNPGGDPSPERARSAIRRALVDEDPQVRAQAARALAELESAQVTPPAGPGGRKGLVVVVRAVSDRTGRARPELRARMRSAIMGQLRGEPRVTSVAETMVPEASYIIDGTIARLEHTSRGGDVEIVCGVELLLSRPPRGMVLVASGEATVQKPRTYFRPTLREPLENEALDHAVRSAHENLARFFANER
jgi:hypothetical protein